LRPTRLEPKFCCRLFERAREVNWRPRCLVRPRCRRSVKPSRPLSCAVSMPLSRHESSDARARHEARQRRARRAFDAGPTAAPRSSASQEVTHRRLSPLPLRRKP
jgi:hypothetical protein